MSSLNITSKNNFYENNKPKFNKIKTIKKNRSSSYIEENNHFFNKGSKRNKNIFLESKAKSFYNYRPSFSPPKSTLNKYKKYPLLIFDKAKPKKDPLNIIEKLKNYEKMKKYKIKLKKIQKVENNSEDKLFKFLHENGLHYSFSSNKYFIGDNLNYYSKYHPDRLKINYSRSKNNLVICDINISKEKDNESSYKSESKNDQNQLLYSTTNEDDDDRMSYEKYMKLQSIADIRFRPKFGDSSYDLVNYIRKIENIRKGVVNDLIDQINNVENRYNKEYPKEDSKFTTKMQGLYHHKWKNIFPLKDYQNLFAGNVKGKISSKNYEIMNRNFNDIFFTCFSTDNIRYSKIKPLEI